jgi:hypothetical protein
VSGPYFLTSCGTAKSAARREPSAASHHSAADFGG